MASVQLLVTGVGLSNETFQKECECAGSDFVYEFSVEKTKVHASKYKVLARASANPLHKSEIRVLYIEGELKLNLYRISVWLVATVGLRYFVQLTSNMFVVVLWLIRDCRISISTKQ